MYNSTYLISTTGSGSAGACGESDRPSLLASWCAVAAVVVSSDVAVAAAAVAEAAALPSLYPWTSRLPLAPTCFSYFPPVPSLCS